MMGTTGIGRGCSGVDENKSVIISVTLRFNSRTLVSLRGCVISQSCLHMKWYQFFVPQQKCRCFRTWIITRPNNKIQLISPFFTNPIQSMLNENNWGIHTNTRHTHCTFEVLSSCALLEVCDTLISRWYLLHNDRLSVKFYEQNERQVPYFFIWSNRILHEYQ